MTTTPPNATTSADALQNTSDAQAMHQSLTTLDTLVAQMCFCKLRSHCPDKSSPECLKHHNLYAEFMMRNQPKPA